MKIKLAEIRVAVITISDRSFHNERIDLSGPALYSKVITFGWKVNFSTIVSDDPDQIEGILRQIIERSDIDLILTSGGTGISPRDNTPEVTLKVIEKYIPGIVEQMRSVGSQKTPNAILSRAVAGTAKDKLIINLPGSPGGAVDSLEAVAGVIPHALGMLGNQDLHQ